jgi:hypothetical protein
LSDLREAFVRVFADKDMTQDDQTILDIHPVEARAGESPADAGLLGSARRSMRGILAKDDRIVLVSIRRNTSYYGLAVSVRMQDGKVRVVGFDD